MIFIRLGSGEVIEGFQVRSPDRATEEDNNMPGCGGTAAVTQLGGATEACAANRRML